MPKKSHDVSELTDVQVLCRRWRHMWVPHYDAEIIMKRGAPVFWTTILRCERGCQCWAAEDYEMTPSGAFRVGPRRGPFYDEAPGYQLSIRVAMDDLSSEWFRRHPPTMRKQ